jgi:hypothetical protein
MCAVLITGLLLRYCCVPHCREAARLAELNKPKPVAIKVRCLLRLHFSHSMQSSSYSGVQDFDVAANRLQVPEWGVLHQICCA